MGLAWLGHSRLFRYEVRRWSGGVIPDVAEAVRSPRRLSVDRDRAQQVLDLVVMFPTRTWGRDELGTGEMWNSNSLTSWLLAESGHEMGTIDPPPHGRAPGWAAGLVVAGRDVLSTWPDDTGAHDAVRPPAGEGSLALPATASPPRP